MRRLEQHVNRNANVSRSKPGERGFDMGRRSAGRRQHAVDAIRASTGPDRPPTNRLRADPARRPPARRQQIGTDRRSKQATSLFSATAAPPAAVAWRPGRRCSPPVGIQLRPLSPPRSGAPHRTRREARVRPCCAACRPSGCAPKPGDAVAAGRNRPSSRFRETNNEPAALLVAQPACASLAVSQPAVPVTGLAAAHRREVSVS